MMSSGYTVPVTLAVVLAAALAAPTRLAAQAFADPQFGTDVIASLPQFTPTGIDWSPDGRMFILQKHGVIRVVRDGVLLPTPFLDISHKVNVTTDSGLLGIAFHPDFSNNGFVYLAYVFEQGGNPNDDGPKISRIVRVRADPANPDVAVPGSETVILGGCQTSGPGADCLYVDHGIHTVGTLRFAPDGKLMVGHGDGGNIRVDDPNLRAQDLDSLNGKILRVNDDGTAPSDNPFFDGDPFSNRSKVWAYGLRNPFRFVLHPVTGIPHVGDVGWNDWEELDIASRGANLGWPCYEGVFREPEHTEAFPQCAALQPAAVVAPFHPYGRSVGASVLAGDFYRGTAYPELYRGNLFFADFVEGFIKRVVFDANGNPASFPVFATGIDGIVDLKQGPDGVLYYADFVSGQIRRIRFNGPTAAASATPTDGYSPLAVTFSSAGSTAPSGGTLTYLWDFGDGTTSTEANPVHVYTASSVRSFVAQLTVSSGGLTSRATLRITVGSRPPEPVILTPAEGSSFQPGEIVSYQGSANDADDGMLPASALTWTVLLHHNTHIHTFVGSAGTSGSFQTEYHGVGNFAYELVLTATDSSGLSRTARRLLPLTPDTTPPTAPASLTATLVGADIRLSWAPSTDDFALAGYRLERCQGTACATFALIASPSTTTYTDTGLALAASYSYRVRGVDAAGLVSAYSPVASATTPETSPLGAITGERSTPTGTVSLTTGATDWAHWGLSSPTTVTRKAGIAPLISGVTVVGFSPSNSYSGHPLTFTWSDGAPTATASTTTGIYVGGTGNGFRLTVPADTVRRRLTLYAGVWRAQGRLVASLSDGSAPDYVDTGLNDAVGTTPARYTIEYQASAANQSLTITFTQASPSGGNVTLQAATLVETVPDFAISASPSALTAEPGEAVSYAIAVSRINGFAGSVGLDLSGLPPGATATFTPSTVTGSGSTSTLTVTTAPGTTSSSWPLTVTGTSGALTRTATATLDVVSSDFTLTAAPASRTIGPGGTASYTVTVAPLAGFSGSIALSAGGLPAGASAVFVPAIIVGGSGSATLTISTTAATPAGISSLTVTGTSDALTRSTSVSLVVETPDYLVFATPSSRTLAPGDSTTYNISTAPSGGFAGTRRPHGGGVASRRHRRVLTGEHLRNGDVDVDGDAPQHCPRR